MVVFGDSLSDPGNVFVVTGEVSVRPYATGNIPGAPYPIGQGKTFSNGPTWAQVVAKELKLKGGTGPALRTTRFTNYAFGGARAASTAGGYFDMSAQVTAYLADSGGFADSDTLYAVFLGGNDVRDALVAFLTVMQSGGLPADAQAAAEAVIADAVLTYASNILALASVGAKDFLIPNVPNVGVAPSITAFGPEVSFLTTQLSFGFNMALSSTLEFINEFVVPLNITHVDMFTLITAAVASPVDFGFDNVVDACLTPLVYKGAICKKPDGYLFWDGIHPTKAGHQMMADEALEALE